MTFNPQPKPEKRLKKKPKRPNKKSVKLKVAQEEYSSLRMSFLIVNNRCEAEEKGCTYEATQVHHRKGRLGALLNNVTYFMAVCANCHDWVERNAAEAKQKGYSLSRLSI